MNMTYFITESITQEANVVKSNANKAIFWMAVQDADTQNRNKRIYPFNVLNGAINNCMTYVRNRCFYGELDHPIPTSDDQFNEVRQTTVLLKESSHIITDFQWKGKVLFGKFETLSNTPGKEALALVRDRTRIGTSMRGLAELERSPQGISYVKDPLHIISFDLVSHPSHQTAVIDEKDVKFESIVSDRKKKEMVFESNITERADNQLVCTEDGKCFLADYLDKLIEQKTVDFIKENWS